MINEVIWTAGAAQDYLQTPAIPSNHLLDAIIELLKLFPELGSPVNHAPNVRRALAGTERHFGLYYSHTKSRIIILALLDLRQSPAKIETILSSRDIDS